MDYLSLPKKLPAIVDGKGCSTKGVPLTFITSEQNSSEGA